MDSIDRTPTANRLKKALDDVQLKSKIRYALKLYEEVYEKHGRDEIAAIDCIIQTSNIIERGIRPLVDLEGE